MLRSLFVLGIMIPGLVAAVSNRVAALLLYLWFALFRPQEWLWVDITPWRPSLILGALVVVPAMVSGIFPNVTHPLSVGALMFLGAGLISQARAVDPALAWYWVDYSGRLILICLLMVSLLSTQKRLLLAVAVISGSFAFHSAKAGLVGLLRGGVQYSAGIGGSFSDNNGYALGTVMVIPLLVAVAQNCEHRWIRRGFFIAVPLSIFTVVCTFSRGGFLALVAASLALFWLQRRRVMAALALVPLLVTASLLVPVPAGYGERLSTIQQYQAVGDESALSRMHFWRVAVRMAEDRPLGVGLGNYEAAYDVYDFSGGRYGRGRAVHSSHLQVLAETGYAGITVYTALFLWAVGTLFRIRSRAANSARLPPAMQHYLRTMSGGLFASIVGFLVGGAFISLALNDLTWMTFALVAALDRLSKQMVSDAREPAGLKTQGSGR